MPYSTPGGVPPYNPNDSKRIAAGVLGILLGGLGIHKFILGYNTAGIIMLVVTLVLTPFTCGMGWVVMHVIGIVEGILYLTKSDEEFYRTYVGQNATGSDLIALQEERGMSRGSNRARAWASPSSPCASVCARSPVRR